MACYVPKFLWGAFEGGLMRTIVLGLNHGICEENEKRSKIKVLMGYLEKHMKLHRNYVFRYFFCEFLCLVNIVVQMILMNKFFAGEFFTYGLRVWSFSEEDQDNRVDPMVFVFPRVTKCVFHKYGASGSIQKHDSLCLLPLNIVNEKTYIFIWFWFLILALMLVGLMIYR